MPSPMPRCCRDLTATVAWPLLPELRGTPPERSKISVELTGGLVCDGPFGRDSDMVGFGVTSDHIGQRLDSIAH
jgi:hypothetical protein